MASVCKSNKRKKYIMVKSEEKEEGMWSRLPTEIWVQIFGYVLAYGSHLHFSLRILKVCKLWNNIILKNIYVPLIPTNTRREWLEPLIDGSHIALSHFHANEHVGVHNSDLIHPNRLYHVFMRLFISLRVRVISYILYAENKKIYASPS